MKSKLFFVPSHHNFDKEGFLATEEMLDYKLYPLLNSNDEVMDPNVVKIYKDAFNALTNITPFWAKVSMEVNIENKCFLYPKRVWGQIYLYDKIVSSLSHDTRFNNCAFYGLLEWPELTNYPSSANYQGKDLEFKKIMNWSSVENWITFFKERLNKIGSQEIEEGIIKQAEGEKLITAGQEILDALSL